MQEGPAGPGIDRPRIGEALRVLLRPRRAAPAAVFGTVFERARAHIRTAGPEGEYTTATPWPLAEVALHHQRLLVIDLLGLRQRGRVRRAHVDPQPLLDAVRHARRGRSARGRCRRGSACCCALSLAGSSGEGAREKLTRDTSFGFCCAKRSIAVLRELQVAGDVDDVELRPGRRPRARPRAPVACSAATPGRPAEHAAACETCHVPSPRVAPSWVRGRLLGPGAGATRACTAS